MGLVAMAPSIFELEKGGLIRIVPYTLAKRSIVDAMKEGFTGEQGKEIDATLEWFEARHLKREVVPDFVSSKEYSVNYATSLIFILNI